MSQHDWLVAYDICDRRRLQRVHKRMRRHATAIEYSVFWLTGTQGERLKCLQEVVPLMDLAGDDLRMYALPSRGLQLRLGQAVLPGGIVWSGLPACFAWDSDVDMDVADSAASFFI
jgi:CRISPR-associated protein Cas2